MTKRSRFEQLFDKRLGMIKPGLDRVKKAYSVIGSPLHSEEIPVILIGGTNGKGSTAGQLWQYLTAGGLKCGLYTSPHLRSFSERFQISGEIVTDDDLVTAWQNIKNILDAELYSQLSFFEVATLIGMKLFAQRGCQIVLLEVGLGGRLDATNIVEPILSIIVSVSRDHEAYLGSHLDQILEEKLGIARSGKPLFWGAAGECMQDERCLERIAKLKASAEGPLLLEMGQNFGYAGNDQFFYESALPNALARKRCVNLPLAGHDRPTFMKRNAIIALASYCYLQESLPELCLPVVDRIIERMTYKSLPSTYSMVGRFEVRTIHHLGLRKQILFDVCHNIDGVREHDRNLKEQGLLGCPAFVSILNDKAINEMLDILRSSHDTVILFQLDSDRSLRPESLAARHQDLLLFESFAKAWQYALRAWGEREIEPWAICGSVMAVGNCLEYFDIDVLAAE